MSNNTEQHQEQFAIEMLDAGIISGRTRDFVQQMIVNLGNSTTREQLYNRLEAAQRDLDQVNDLIDELLTKMNEFDKTK